MPLWIWVLLIGLVFLISYDKRAGRLGEFFGPELIEDGNSSQGKTQGGRDTGKLH